MFWNGLQSGELLDLFVRGDFSDRINDFFYLAYFSRGGILFCTKTPLAASAKLMEQLFQYYPGFSRFPTNFKMGYIVILKRLRILSGLPEYQEETLEKAKQL